MTGAAPDAAEGEAWVRHVKRGTEYEVLGQAQMQAAEPVGDDALVMVYRGRDGALWVRPTDEFRDGRFEPCPAPHAEIAMGAVKAELPVLHVRGDLMPLMLAVVAAARAWKEARQSQAPWLDVVGAALRLERAVDAYEAALPHDASAAP